MVAASCNCGYYWWVHWSLCSQRSVGICLPANKLIDICDVSNWFCKLCLSRHVHALYSTFQEFCKKRSCFALLWVGCYHFEVETRWPPFSRRHFQMHFLEWKYNKPLSEPMMIILLTHICGTRPQWDKGWFHYHIGAIFYGILLTNDMSLNSVGLIITTPNALVDVDQMWGLIIHC